jgi:hypothetical protein
MSQFGGLSVFDIVKIVLEDGVIDLAEVEHLRQRLYEGYQISMEEAEALFRINEAIVGQNNADSWQTLFVEAICDYLLTDEETPGIVDEREADWLLRKITADGKEPDIGELAILSALKAKARALPDSLLKKMNKYGIA